jgi:hypothetical protein
LRFTDVEENMVGNKQFTIINAKKRKKPGNREIIKTHE